MDVEIQGSHLEMISTQAAEESLLPFYPSIVFRKRAERDCALEDEIQELMERSRL
jgi:hypothetical protein